MKQVDPSLWLGNAGDGRDFQRLLNVGIGAVVQLAAEEPILQLPRDIVYFHIPLLDGAGNDPRLLTLAIDTVTMCCRVHLPTLVCCGAGMSRSPAIAAIALARVRGKTPENRLAEIARQHACDVAPALWKEVVELSGDTA